MSTPPFPSEARLGTSSDGAERDRAPQSLAFSLAPSAVREAMIYKWVFYFAGAFALVALVAATLMQGQVRQRIRSLHPEVYSRFDAKGVFGPLYGANSEFSTLVWKGRLPDIEPDARLRGPLQVLRALLALFYASVVFLLGVGLLAQGHWNS